MAAIEIERITDSHDCDTCGCTFADGAIVRIDGAVALELEPCAYCFDGTSYDDEDIFGEILRHLGSPLVYTSEDGGRRRLIEAMGHSLSFT
jgi:hypothetical protein